MGERIPPLEKKKEEPFDPHSVPSVDISGISKLDNARTSMQEDMDKLSHGAETLPPGMHRRERGPQSNGAEPMPAVFRENRISEPTMELPREDGVLLNLFKKRYGAADAAAIPDAEDTPIEILDNDDTPFQRRKKLRELIMGAKERLGGVTESVSERFKNLSQNLTLKNLDLTGRLRRLGVNIFEDVKATSRGVKYVITNPRESLRAARSGAERAAAYSAYFASRSASWDEKGQKLKTDFTTLTENYNKLPIRQKFYITATLIGVSALTAAAALPTLSSIFASGMYAQRALGGAGFALNRRKGMDERLAANPDAAKYLGINIADKSDAYKNALAGVLGVIYTGGTALAGHWATEKLTHWFGNILGHHPASPGITQPAAAAAAGEVVASAPAVPEMPSVGPPIAIPAPEVPHATNLVFGHPSQVSEAPTYEAPASIASATPAPGVESPAIGPSAYEHPAPTEPHFTPPTPELHSVSAPVEQAVVPPVPEPHSVSAPIQQPRVPSAYDSSVVHNVTNPHEVRDFYGKQVHVGSPVDEPLTEGHIDANPGMAHVTVDSGGKVYVDGVIQVPAEASAPSVVGISTPSAEASPLPPVESAGVPFEEEPPLQQGFIPAEPPRSPGIDLTRGVVHDSQGPPLTEGTIPKEIPRARINLTQGPPLDYQGNQIHVGPYEHLAPVEPPHAATLVPEARPVGIPVEHAVVHDSQGHAVLDSYGKPVHLGSYEHPAHAETHVSTESVKSSSVGEIGPHAYLNGYGTPINPDVAHGYLSAKGIYLFGGDKALDVQAQNYALEHHVSVFVDKSYKLFGLIHVSRVVEFAPTDSGPPAMVIHTDPSLVPDPKNFTKRIF
jgi:hypothetical protein